MKTLIATLIFGTLWSVSFAQLGTYYVNANQLNLRQSATTVSDVIKVLPNGTSVEVLNQTNGWSKVSVNGPTGYVSSRYLSASQVTPMPQVQESSVLICGSSNSYAFHRYKCRGLSRCKAGISTVSKSEAGKRGYRACKICY